MSRSNSLPLSLLLLCGVGALLAAGVLAGSGGTAARWQEPVAAPAVAGLAPPQAGVPVTWARSLLCPNRRNCRRAALTTPPACATCPNAANCLPGAAGPVALNPPPACAACPNAANCLPGAAGPVALNAPPACAACPNAANCLPNAARPAAPAAFAAPAYAADPFGTHGAPVGLASPAANLTFVALPCVTGNCPL